MDAAQGRQGLLAEWRLALWVTQQRTESSDVSRPRGPAWRDQAALASEVWPSPSTCSGHLQQLTEVTSASYTLSSSRVFPTALRWKLHASHKIKSNLAGSLFLYREQWSKKECCVLHCLDGEDRSSPGGLACPRTVCARVSACMCIYMCVGVLCMCVRVSVYWCVRGHMPMCPCLRVHARMCRCVHCIAHACAQMCVCLYAQLPARVHTCTHTHVSIYECAQACVHVPVCTRVCIYTWMVYVYRCAYTLRTCIQVLTHSHICARALGHRRRARPRVHALCLNKVVSKSHELPCSCPADVSSMLRAGGGR